MITFDPTKVLTEPADALTIAGALLNTPRAGLDSRSFWTTAAEAPFAAMLYAASACGNGKGIGWVLLAVDNLHKDDTNPDAPGWNSAAKEVAAVPLLHDALIRTLALAPKQRDSIVITMRDALSPWMRATKESTSD